MLCPRASAVIDCNHHGNIYAVLKQRRTLPIVAHVDSVNDDIQPIATPDRNTLGAGIMRQYSMWLQNDIHLWLLFVVVP